MWQLRWFFRQLPKPWETMWLKRVLLSLLVERRKKWYQFQKKTCQHNMHSVFSLASIVDQVSLLTPSNFRFFLAGSRGGSLKSACCEELLHSWSSIIGIDSRSTKPEENEVAQRFLTTCLGEQREGTKNSKPRCTWIIWKWDIPWLWHIEWLFRLASFPSSQSYFLGKQFPKALSQWSHLETCHAIILEEFQDAASTETWGSKRILWFQWSICDNMICVISVSFNYDAFWKWWKS